jgi:hypothetical protein
MKNAPSRQPSAGRSKFKNHTVVGNSEYSFLRETLALLPEMGSTKIFD